MLDPQLEKSLNLAVESAHEKGYEFVSLEHILVSLLTSNDEAKEIFLACGANLKELKKSLDKYIAENCPVIPEDIRKSDRRWKPELTLAFHRLLQRSAIQVQSAGKIRVTCGHLIVALYQEEESYAKYALEAHGIYQFDVINYISHGIEKMETSEGSNDEDNSLAIDVLP